MMGCLEVSLLCLAVNIISTLVGFYVGAMLTRAKITDQTIDRAMREHLEDTT